MTSEILIMNQRAIALAADSAVTLIDGGRIIVRNDQKKLFNLADGVPVGVMFFGVADLMGHPWDVLIEHTRTDTKPLPHVHDYAETLFAQLDGHEGFFPAARYDDEYKRLVASVHRFIFRYAHYLVESGAEGPDEAILGEAVERIWMRYQSYPDGRPRRDLDCFPPGFSDRIAREYGDIIADMTGYSFAAFSLDRKTRQRLHDIALLCVVKDLFLEDVTGLVFGGFGTGEPYPAVVTYNVSAVVCGILKRARIDETAIDGSMHAAISLYADSEATYAFLRGMAFDIEARVYGTIHAAASQLVDTVVASIGDIDPVRSESVRREALGEHVPQAVQDCYEAINDYQQRAYIDPLLSVMEISTRQDLAETAHELVALNIFKKRITAQDQTVGGAIDVAVISRDAGFHWFKRQGVRS